MESKRFTKSYNALVTAYYDGTLAKGTCVACAVGNIVADAMGGIVRKNGGYGYNCSKSNTDWSNLFTTHGGRQVNNISLYSDEANKLYELTGYTAEEMAKIEYAFETNTTINYDRATEYTDQEILEDQYNGLAAVIDVMLELEGVQDNGHKEKLRAHPKLQAV